MNKQKVTLNKEHALYVIHCGDGYSCLGFDVLEQQYIALDTELKTVSVYTPEKPARRGTLRRYAQYRKLSANALTHYNVTGHKLQCFLTPELIGNEGHRVQVTHQYPGGAIETARFIVGRSTGHLPIHLAIPRRDSNSGPGVCLGNVISVTRLD